MVNITISCYKFIFPKSKDLELAFSLENWNKNMLEMIVIIYTPLWPSFTLILTRIQRKLSKKLLLIYINLQRHKLRNLRIHEKRKNLNIVRMKHYKNSFAAEVIFKFISVHFLLLWILSYNYWKFWSKRKLSEVSALSILDIGEKWKLRNFGDFHFFYLLPFGVNLS